MFKSCGVPAFSFIRCDRKKLGYWGFWRSQSDAVDVAKRGGSFIGLNLICASSGKSGERQPIQPVFRRWLNVIYIDVNAVEGDFHLSEEAQAWWQLPTTQQTLQQARDADWVDYSTVNALKK